MFSNVLIKGYGHDDHKGCDHKGYDNKGQTAFIMFAIGAAALAAYLQANPAPRLQMEEEEEEEDDLTNMTISSPLQYKPSGGKK
jgi:hypothetical protein